MIKKCITRIVMVRVFTCLMVSALVLPLIACQATRTAFPLIESTEEEARIQRKMASEKQLDRFYQKEEKRIQHELRLLKVSRKIAKSVIPMCDALHIKQDSCVYEVKLADQSLVNAWADGDTIYVTGAMMNFAKKDSDLAYIVAHEMAHNMMSHVSTTKRNALIGLIFGQTLDYIVDGKTGYNTGGVFEDTAQNIAVGSFSKEMEREADYVGLYLASHAGYNMKGVEDVWRRMSERYGGSIYVTTSHPSNPERTLAIRKVLDEIELKRKKKHVLVPNLRK